MKDRYKNYLKQIKKGDTIKVCIIGAGITSSPEERVVEQVDPERKLLWLDGADGYYDKKSVYAYSLETGKTVSNYAPGFYAEIHF